MKPLIFVVCTLMVLAACKTSGPSLFGKRSPHEQYGNKLESAGLKNTAAGSAWFAAAASALSNPLNIILPYKEFGYFDDALPKAVGLRFTGRRGEKLTITLEKKPAASFAIFLELWQVADGKTKLVEAADTTASTLEYELDEDQQLILRLQPELLSSGEYTLVIRNGPSLAFPVQTQKQVIGSYWGADRDGGARRHEGVDIFAARGTPLLAAADGRITRVDETNIGGKTVWLRPSGKNFVLYYAHLDEQRVSEGQQVKAGDVVGTTGNTGNARTTSPHLHFGIYAAGGAIDPLHFIQPNPKTAPPPSGSSKPGSLMVTTRTSQVYSSPQNDSGMLQKLEPRTPVAVEAAYGSWYRVRTPDQQLAWLPVSSLERAINTGQASAANETALFESPSPSSPRKAIIPKGGRLSKIGAFNGFSYVRYGDIEGWTKK